MSGGAETPFRYIGGYGEILPTGLSYIKAEGSKILISINFESKTRRTNSDDFIPFNVLSHCPESGGDVTG